MPLHTVAALQDRVSLLAGTFTILGRDGTQVSVPYNGSAREAITGLMLELVGSLKPITPRDVGLALVDPSHTYAAASQDLAMPTDTALVSALRDVGRGRPQLLPFAWHERSVLRAQGQGLVSLARRVLDSLTPMTLHGAILATDSHTLEVIGRNETMARGTGPVHSTTHLVIALDAIESVTLTLHPTYPTAVIASLDLGASAVEVIVPSDSQAHRILWQASEASARG